MIKLTAATLLAACAFSTIFHSSAAFVSPRPVATTASSSSQSALEAATSRRDIMNAVAAALLILPKPASAEVDYEKIQDLLGSSLDNKNAAYTAQPQTGKRPTWLTEPTEEFKENETKAAEFKRKNLQAKQAFASTLDVITTAPNDEGKLIASLDEMRRLVKQSGGLPTGITKEEIVKTVRRRKAKKYWPVACEIAYQDLLYEIGYQQSPNTDRDSSFL